MFFAVLACMVAFFTVLFMTIIDLIQTVMPVLGKILSWEFASDASELHQKTLKRVVGLVDSFLVAIFLLLFAYGMYELFVSELDPARPAGKDLNSKSAPAVLGLLPIHSLDDLKSNLVKVITAILIVTLFEHAVAVNVETPIELIYFAAAILLVALALYVIHLATNLRFAHGEAGANDGAITGPSDSAGDSSTPAIK